MWHCCIKIRSDHSLRIDIWLLCVRGLHCTSERNFLLVRGNRGENHHSMACRSPHPENPVLMLCVYENFRKGNEHSWKNQLPNHEQQKNLHLFISNKTLNGWWVWVEISGAWWRKPQSLADSDGIFVLVSVKYALHGLYIIWAAKKGKTKWREEQQNENTNKSEKKTCCPCHPQ